MRFIEDFVNRGLTKETLLNELQGDIKEQVEKYDLPQLITHMVFANHDNSVVFAHKKPGEAPFKLILRPNT